jgi:hypothetical protein
MTAMKERAAIGTRWRRRRDKTLWVLWQSHRADRIAELRSEVGEPMRNRRLFVSFTDLRTKFEEVA